MCRLELIIRRLKFVKKSKEETMNFVGNKGERKYCGIVKKGYVNFECVF